MTNPTAARARKATRTTTPDTAPVRRRAPRKATAAEASPEPVAAAKTPAPGTMPVRILDRTITVTIPSPDQLVAYRRIGTRLANSPTGADIEQQMGQFDDVFDMIGGLMGGSDMRWIEAQIAAGRLTILNMVQDLFNGLAAAGQAAAATPPTTGPKTRARRR